jgi:hypothetical protein
MTNQNSKSADYFTFLLFNFYVLIFSKASMPLEIQSAPLLKNKPEMHFGTDLSPQIAQLYGFIADYFKNFEFARLAAFLKMVSVILTIVLGAIIVLIMIKMSDLIKEELTELKTEINPPKEAVTPYDNRWQEIKNHVNSFKESEWKMAVIEADKLVDDALKVAGFPGESMGERLMLIKPGQLLSIQYLWDAHKLRNLLVHDANYQITHRQAIWAVEAFERVLRELGALS